MRTHRTTISRKQKWEEKQIYGRFKRLTSDISLKKTWMWLKKRDLKRETTPPDSSTKQFYKNQSYQSKNI